MANFRGLAPAALVRRATILAGLALVLAATLGGDPMDTLTGGRDAAAAGFGWGLTAP